MGTTSGTKVAAERIVDRGTATTSDLGRGTPPGAGSANGSSSSGSSSGSAAANGGPPSGGGVPGGGAPGGGFGVPVTGQVTKVDGSTITLKSASGTTYVVTTSSSTTVTVEKTISLADLTTGEPVVVMGTTSNGVVTATQIRAGALGGRDGGPGAMGGTPPSGQGSGS